MAGDNDTGGGKGLPQRPDTGDARIDDWIERSELDEAREKARRAAEEAREERERLEVLKAQLDEVRSGIDAGRQPPPPREEPTGGGHSLAWLGALVLLLGLLAGGAAFLLAPGDEPVVDAEPVAEPAPEPAEEPPPAPAKKSSSLTAGASESQLGTLSLSSQPASSKRVGGERVGSKDWTGKVAAGTYDIEFRTTDGRQMVQEVTIVAGQAVSLCWDFDRMAECGSSTAPATEGLKRQ